MDFKKFEKVIKEIDNKKYHICRTVQFSSEGPYISEWAIFRKDMSFEEYFSPENLAILSSQNGNTLEDIKEFIENQKIEKITTKNIKIIKPQKNVAAVYFCNNCNEMIRDFRYDDLKIKKYNYCPYCGIDLKWGGIR